jgi:hypothetical protein
MNPHSPTPSSGSRRSARPGGMPTMSQRQTEAYLLARDAVRRIQRTSSLVAAASQRLADGARGNRHDRQQNH